MRRRFPSLAAFVWLCTLWGAWWNLPMSPAHADDATATTRDPNQVAAEVMDARYQRVDDAAEAAGNGASKGDTAAGRPGDELKPTPTREARPRREASATSTSFSSLVWIVLAIVVILAVAALVITPGGSLDVAAIVADDVPTPAPAATVAVQGPRAALRQPRQTADQLAAEGKFAEAIHALLQQTLGELVVVAKHKISDAATSREIARQLTLAPAAGQALAALIAAVERTHFGDEVPAHGDYAQCRATFDVFAQTYRGGGARMGQPGGRA